MSTQALDDLLERLSSGDPVAAEQAFLAYAPYLRGLVRRRLSRALRARLDSSDVVQSVWAHLLASYADNGWCFESADHLRAFLITATRHRLIDRQRRHLPALAREQPLALTPPAELPPSREPRPSERARADDLWERLLRMCPPEHHPVLALRREGLLLGEIAARTGLHEGSVRRILRGLARRMALEETENEDPP
jgi:RNA polymerase sigma-70 factor (ECF subfamily)